MNNELMIFLIIEKKSCISINKLRYINYGQNGKSMQLIQKKGFSQNKF